jgi:hypothetical protein
MSLKKYKSQGKIVEVTLNSKEETLNTFAWILSKNWTSFYTSFKSKQKFSKLKGSPYKQHDL